VICELHIARPSFDGPVPRALAQSGYELSWLEPEVHRQDDFSALHLVATPSLKAARAAVS
jgi:hypothetical protein